MKRALFFITIVFSGLAAGRAQVKDQAVPPLSYVCPMVGDEDVIEDTAGRCRKCGMELKPIRLDSIWTCPVHAAVIKDKPGACPIDGRDLVQVTMAVSWTCANTNIDSVNPGTCADGSPMVKKFSPRAHGNHNPQHGGLFFMAPDNWHHLEGTYRDGGVFRMYLYDDFTKPLARDQVRLMTGRILMKGGASIPLVPVQNGRYLEAKIGKLPFPAEMAAKLQFKSTSPEHHFDFTFPEYSKEPVAPVTTTAAAPVKQPPSAQSPQNLPGNTSVTAAAPTSSGSAAPASAAVPSASGVDPGLIPLPIPDSVPEMLAQLSQRTEQIRRFIDQGQFASVYVPAFQAKDLALALDERKNDLRPEHFKIAAPAIKRLVRSAWLLDAFGDIGNKQQISDAYTQFAAAVKDVESVFPGK
jgi:heavy metal-binding protein